MDMIGLALVCGAVALVVGSLSAGVVVAFAMRRGGPASLLTSSEPAETVILIEDDRIVDATAPARAFLSALGDGGWSAERLQAHLISTFPGYATALATLDERRRVELASRDRAQILALAAEGRRRRLVLRDAERRTVMLDRTCQAALEDELETLRLIGDALPHPVWQQRRTGQIVWANAAYVALMVEQDRGDAATWPPVPLFRIDHTMSGDVGRVRLLDADEETEGGWYDCHVRTLPTGTLVTAVPADAQIRAETTLREFVQTFSRTFAHLTVGLAVFNRQRRLMLFNPALTDLTELPVDILLGQPTLHSFLDALRARNMMPEPRNHASWHERVADVARTSADSTYSEMWHLPGNRTYRVTGRPQPDGAFALLDISAEIGLTRRFRAQIETGHAVLNALDDAVAVFDRAGILTLSNIAYDRLWGLSTSDGMSQLTAAEALRTWLDGTLPTPVWGDVREFLAEDTERAEWSETIRMRDGRSLRASFSPLPGGASLVRFAGRPPTGPARLVPVAATGRHEEAEV